MSEFTFIDLFAGIGGFRIALESLGGKCVFSSEWNKFSRITYSENFGQEPCGDITKIDENSIPDHDILSAGFPCQPFSIAGVSKKNSLGKPHGFLDKLQGNLFFDIARIIKAKRPKAFILENVKNLIHHDKGKTFHIIMNTLTNELGYIVFWKVIDASSFVPQHRERIIIVGFRDDMDYSKFVFPENHKNRPDLLSILDERADSKYTLTDKMWEYLQDYAEKHRKKGNGFGYGLIDPKKEKITRTLSARYYKDGSEILIYQEGKPPRRLTPEECRRLMGFPEGFKIPVSDAQAYRQFGNAVVPEVIKTVAANVIKVMEDGQNKQGEEKQKHVQNQIS
ncbi:MAG: DNA (cytosine-5-)-methyltransferase [Thermoplasmatales archaeon]|nr:MAG: DNA (cytosine-5-)-methyltransferase [Thermoplasmatales archaeon]